MFRRYEWMRCVLVLGTALIAGTGCAGGARLSDKSAEPTSGADCLTVYVLYSPSCVQCRYVKPAAERLADEVAGRATVLLVPADGPDGRRLRERYAIRCLPAVQAVGPSGSAAGRMICGFASYEGLRRAVGEALQAAGCDWEKGADPD